MLDGRNVVFLYDGSFYGLLTAVFEAYYRRVVPFAIETDENVQQALLCDYVSVDTDAQKARRVEKSVLEKISASALYNIYYAYLSNMEDKGLTIFNYIRAGYKYGRAVNNYLTLDSVNSVITAARNVRNETHLFKEFIRFSELKNGVYYAAIEPKNNVLPALEEHFTHRYSSMPFLIHDTVHEKCLGYNGRETVILDAASVPRLDLSDTEQKYRDLWKCFFDTVEIKERHNEQCQNTHLPKRFRKNMTEFKKDSL